MQRAILILIRGQEMAPSGLAFPDPSTRDGTPELHVRTRPGRLGTRGGSQRPKRLKQFLWCSARVGPPRSARGELAEPRRVRREAPHDVDGRAHGALVTVDVVHVHAGEPQAALALLR